MKKAESDQVVLSKPRVLSQKRHIAPVLILLSVCPGTFLSHFSAGLINIALPDLSLYFQAPLSITQWIVTGYLLAVMIGLPVMGKLSDIYGRKRIHNLGYLVFGIGVLLSAVSLSLGFLLVARVIQGLGASMLQSANMAIVTACFPEEKRGKALGIIGTAVGLGALLGPSTGGVLINLFSWQMLFWIQVPIIAIVYFMALRFIPKDEPKGSASKFDYGGAVLFGVAITSIIFVLNQIGEVGMGFYLLPITVIGFVSLILFLHRVRRVKNPFIQLNIFSPPMVRAGSFIIIVSYMATFSSMVVVPFFLIGILDTTTSLAGLLLMAYPFFLAIIGPISGSLSDKFSSFKVVIAGLVLMAGSLIGLSVINSHTSIYMVAILLCLLGISMGVLTSPNYNLIIGYVSFQFLGTISSTIALLRNLGMALGTALGVTFMSLWVSGSITDWMRNDDKGQLDNVLMGFHSFFWFVAALTIIVMGYLIKQRWKV